MRSIYALVVALLATASIACGSSSPIAPSSVAGAGNGSTRLNAGDVLPPPAPEVDGISCPSDAPAFKADANPGHVIKLEWQKMPKADYIRIYVWVEHFGHWEIVERSPKVVGEHGQWYDSFKVPDDGIYLVKLATVTCGEQQNLSDGIVVTFGEYVPPPTPLPDPPAPPKLPTPPTDDDGPSDDNNDDSDNPPPPPPPACLVNCEPPPVDVCTNIPGVQTETPEDHTRTGTTCTPIPSPPPQTTYVSYWKMNQGSDNAKRNACENHGGVWLNDYDIPGDFSISKRDDVCRITSPSNNPNTVTPTGNSSDLYNPPGFVQQ